MVSCLYHVHAVVIVDEFSGYRWLHWMRSKDGKVDVVKKWYCDIADLRQKYQVVFIVRENACENSSNEIA